MGRVQGVVSGVYRSATVAAGRRALAERDAGPGATTRRIVAVRERMAVRESLSCWVASGREGGAGGRRGE